MVNPRTNYGQFSSGPWDPCWVGRNHVGRFMRTGCTDMFVVNCARKSVRVNLPTWFLPTWFPFFRSHNLNSQSFKLRASNPRTIAYVHFNTPFESSDLPGAGTIFPD